MLRPWSLVATGLVYLPLSQVKALKRKKVGYIPVQSTAVSRRMIKQRGSRAAIQGRPRRETRLISQLTIDESGDEDDSGIVRHKLPSKKRKSQAAHKLSAIVEANKRNIKKH